MAFIPDPHQSEKSDPGPLTREKPDPDPHRRDADPRTAFNIIYCRYGTYLGDSPTRLDPKRL
jgi:hypothetical protein